MLKFSLRRDARIKNMHLQNSNESLVLTDFLAKMPFLSSLEQTCVTKKELIAGLGKSFFSLLQKKAMFKLHVFSGKTQLFTLNPTAKVLKWPKSPMVFSSLKLSSFAFLRCLEDSLYLECPKSYFSMELVHPKLAMLCQGLSHSQSQEDFLIFAKKAGFSRQACLFFLKGLAVLDALDFEPMENQSKENPLIFWEFHDLLFHSKSRKNRHANGIIRPYRHRELPFETMEKSYQGKIIPLDLVELETKDFFQVLEQRRSQRDFGKPLKFTELCAFLQSSLKVQNFREDSLGGISFRPSPSAGALHGLENYLAVNACSQLPRALYHYNPFSHSLELIPAPPQVLTKLLESAQRMAGASCQPAVHIFSTARFKRYQYKYASLAYSVMLKDLGCQAQTMSLVAEALGLSSVILGDTGIEPLGQALDLDYFQEGVLGSFALGG